MGNYFYGSDTSGIRVEDGLRVMIPPTIPNEIDGTLLSNTPVLHPLYVAVEGTTVKEEDLAIEDWSLLDADVQSAYTWQLRYIHGLDAETGTRWYPWGTVKEFPPGTRALFITPNTDTDSSPPEE